MYVGIRDVCLFPAGYDNIAEALDELDKNFARVAGNRHVGRDDFIVLSRVNINVNDLSPLSKLAQIPSHPVIKTRTNGDHQVGIT